MTRHQVDWAAAATPVGAHAIAQAHLTTDAYAHTRGVAQQAARLARNVKLPRDERALLLCAAWLHEAGGTDLAGRRATALNARREGHERLACLLAHHRFAALEAAIRGEPAVQAEFAVPTGVDESLLMMLDAAVLTTDPAGAPCTPATAVRAMALGVGPGDAAVRAAIALIAQLADLPAGRALVESVVPRPAG